MRVLLLLASLVLAAPALAEDDAVGCAPAGCAMSVSFDSSSERHSYGLLLAAPMSGCLRVRFRVTHVHAGFLGQSPPLAPGQLAVVRLGRGFPQGENRVTVASVGCDAPPAETRRVILANTGPDHSWRSARMPGQQTLHRVSMTLMP